MIDLVCLDVDGTLVGTSGAVRPQVWAAAEEARRSGLHLALCSGRPAFGVTRGYAERLDPDGWHIFQNGASIVHLPSGRSRSASIPPATIAQLIARARAEGRVLEIYSDTEYAVESTTERARQHAELLGVPFAPRPFESLTGPIVRAQWLLAAGEEVSEPHPGLERADSVSPVMPGTVFVNLTPKGVDKGSAVRVLAAAYDIRLERVMVVGDSGNDVPALRAVGYGVAMGNAEPAARAAARYHVADVEGDGVVEALALAQARRR